MRAVLRAGYCKSKLLSWLVSVTAISDTVGLRSFCFRLSSSIHPRHPKCFLGVRHWILDFKWLLIFPAIESSKPSAEGTGGIHDTGKGILPKTEKMLHLTDCKLLLFHVNGSFTTWVCTVCRIKACFSSCALCEICEFLPVTPPNRTLHRNHSCKTVISEICLAWSLWNTPENLFVLGKKGGLRGICVLEISRCFCHMRGTKGLLL